MIVNCINCLQKLPVPDVAFKRNIPLVSCPVCKKHFKPVIKNSIDSPTNKTVLIPTSKTKDKNNYWLVVPDKQQQKISIGKYVVGRKNTTQMTDIMIETEDRTMSRKHFFIEGKLEKGELKFYISNATNKNPTKLNQKEIKEGSYELKKGDVICAGKTNIVFTDNK